MQHIDPTQGDRVRDVPLLRLVASNEPTSATDRIVGRSLNQRSQASASVEYIQHRWGDLIYGSKAELQAMGIGRRMCFPGEDGGPRRRMTVRDPRGFATKVERSHDGVRYCASIPLPGREQPVTTPQQFAYASGVTKCEFTWHDEYVGTADDLAQAGLVRLDKLPGQPGMHKVRVTIFSDGTVFDGPKTSNHPRAREPGAKVIERASVTTYRVYVEINAEETELRSRVAEAARRQWELRMDALPRPAPLALTGLGPPAASFAAQSKKLRLAWDAVRVQTSACKGEGHD